MEVLKKLSIYSYNENFFDLSELTEWLMAKSVKLLQKDTFFNFFIAFY